ncbi:hypothetical protein KIH27_00715 [Mycobacterium sp. M1]|uniref:Uncharacterized protein n=1 Tax=Mycolicibacter acidiphilus TaxID=2835306 RepID=A0ABS5REJ1_9MYCO|nr:hypothetical protein [Mycolicibacter acidiphilus]MBS9532104.1 hypothetical protein [Mycolicibacter acidiphilus]
MPIIVFDEMDTGPAEFAARLPLNGELIRFLAGDDRPDYCLVRLDRPMLFVPEPPKEIPDWLQQRIAVNAWPTPGFDIARASPDLVVQTPDGVDAVWVPALVICARMVGTQISRTMRDLWVDVAYVIDSAQIDEERLDFAKNYPSAIARINLIEP